MVISGKKFFSILAVVAALILGLCLPASAQSFNTVENQAKKLINEGDYRGALDMLELYIKNIKDKSQEKPNLIAAYYLLARTYFIVGLEKDSEKNLRHLFAISPGYTQSEDDLYFKQQVDRIRSEFKATKKENPESVKAVVKEPEPQVVKPKKKIKKSSQKSNRYRSLFYLASSQFYEGKYAQALINIKKAEKISKTRELAELKKRVLEKNISAPVKESIKDKPDFDGKELLSQINFNQKVENLREKTIKKEILEIVRTHPDPLILTDIYKIFRYVYSNKTSSEIYRETQQALYEFLLENYEKKDQEQYIEFYRSYFENGFASSRSNRKYVKILNQVLAELKTRDPKKYNRFRQTYIDQGFTSQDQREDICKTIRSKLPPRDINRKLIFDQLETLVKGGYKGIFEKINVVVKNYTDPENLVDMFEEFKPLISKKRAVAVYNAAKGELYKKLMAKFKVNDPDRFINYYSGYFKTIAEPETERGNYKAQLKQAMQRNIKQNYDRYIKYFDIYVKEGFASLPEKKLYIQFKIIDLYARVFNYKNMRLDSLEKLLIEKLFLIFLVP